MTYRCYHRWFTDTGMYVSIEKEGGLHSIASFNVRYGHSRYALRVEPKKSVRRYEVRKWQEISNWFAWGI